MKHLISIKEKSAFSLSRVAFVNIEPNMTVVHEELSSRSSIDDKLEKLGIRPPGERLVPNNPRQD
jgi:hypothetical protein